MRTFENINWQEKDKVAIYDFMNSLNDEEAFPFLMWLAEHAPEKDIDWLDIFEDIRSVLTTTENVEACEVFIAWFSAKFPEEYASRFEFIERDLCDFYLYKEDTRKLKTHVDFISQYPVPAIDTLTIRLLFQLIYHGYYTEALKYAGAVWRPIINSDQLIGFPAHAFVNTIYASGLQECYHTFLNNQAPDFTKLHKQTIELGFDDDKKLFNLIKSALITPFNRDSITDSIIKGKDDHMYELNIHFLKYMWDTWKIPFMFSDIIWSFVATKKLFGKIKDPANWFYVGPKTMDKHISGRLDMMLGSNSLEIFGKVWGLHYIIGFLHQHQLLSDKHAAEMVKTVEQMKANMITFMGDELWQMNYVFKWPENHLWNSMKPQFEVTFNQPKIKPDNDFEEIFKSLPSSPGIFDEPEQDKEFSEHDHSFYEGSDPYIKSEKDTGRNDTCPCGSGLKFKKCCMKKDEKI